MRRSGLVALLLGLAAPVSAQPAPEPARSGGALLDRLPAGAEVVGFLDLAAWRASPALRALEPAAFLGAVGLEGTELPGLGPDGRLDRLVLGGWPQGEEMSVAVIVQGAWDPAELTDGLAEQGAVEVGIAGRPAWKLPKDARGRRLVVSELAAGVLAVSDWELAPRVIEGGGSLAPTLAAELSALPAGLSAFVLIADPTRAGRVGGVGAEASGLTSGLQSLGAWARAGERLEVGARARARDASTAAQLSGLLQFGLLGLSARGDSALTDALSSLRFETAGDSLQLRFELGPEQLASLASGWLPSAASPAPARAR